MEEKKTSTKEKSNKKINIILLIIIIIGLVLIVCFLIFAPKFKENQEGKKLEKSLVGTWTADSYTIYEFNKNGKGILRIPSDDYSFTYIVHSNKLYIDFEDEDSIDLNFIFSFEDGDLVLQGIKESSGTYRFKRVEE